MRVVSDHRVCVVDEYVAPVEVAASGRQLSGSLCALAR